MATHDYVIDNSTGANVRADINNVLQAILTNNSNSSAPSTTAAYMFWADTTTGILKIRNSANNAWVELLQLDGTLTLEDGSASTPALAFRDDLNTGIFQPGNNQVGISCNGTEVVEFGTSEVVFNDTGADINFRIEGDTDANLLFVDAGNDSVGIGTSSPDSLGALTVSHSGTGERYITLINAADYGYGIGIQFKQPLASGGSVITSGKILSDWVSTNNSIMSFYTTGSSTSAERMRIDSSGRVMIGTTTEGNGDGDDLTIATSGRTGITIRSADDDYGNIFFSDGTSGASEYVGKVQYYHADNSMRFATNANDRLIIDSSGNVLVGTTSTAPILKFGGSAVGFAVKGGQPTLAVEASANSDYVAYLGQSGTNSYLGAVGGGDLIFQLGTAGTERMRIDSSGRLLLGTTTAGHADLDDLTIATSGNTGITIRSGTTSNGTIGFADGTSGNAQYMGLIDYDHNTDLMAFNTNDSLAMSINSDGDVLIGRTTTIDASEVLGIKGPDSEHCTLGITSDGTTNLGIIAFNDDDANFRGRVQYDHNTDSMAFHTAGSERMRIHGNLYTSFGTTSTNPTDGGSIIEGQVGHMILSRSGTGGEIMIRFNRDGSTRGNITVSTSTAYNTTSDYRLKENIVDLTGAISRIKKIMPRRFNFIEDKDKQEIDGFIAHEASIAVPEAVTGTKDEVELTDNIEKEIKKGDPIYQQLDYSKFVPLLTAALQEAVNKIEVLETKVAALEAA